MVSMGGLVMIDELIRQELPVQAIYERDSDCSATVPVHLSIFGLDEKVRTDTSIIADARKTVSAWYNEDMAYYLEVLKINDREIPHLKGYEKFREEWKLEGIPDENGFLKLIWREGDEAHEIAYFDVPVPLHNRHNDFGKFYTPELLKENSWIEVMYRNLTDSEIVFMSPDKMRKYGIENEMARIDESRGIAEVMGTVFSSDYHGNLAKALLLRDFSVFYLNRLLEKAKKLISTN